MSFPPPSQGPQQPGFSQPNGFASRRRKHAFIWLFIAGLLGAWALTQTPLEIGRWHLAWAVKYRTSGDKEAAYRELAAAMERFPRSAELLVRRAEWKLEDGQKQEAIEDFDRIAELAGNKTAALVKRGEVLLKAGQFDKAVEDWKKVEQDSRRSGQPARDVALNQLAYARALAKVELDEALENINRALDIRPNEPSYLDTRGYIYYLKQEYEPALEDLDKSVAGMDSLVSKVKQAPAENRKSSKETDTLSRSERARREIIDGAAVIHYHRALVLKALGRTEDAEKDLDVARELSGREPDETLF